MAGNAELMSSETDVRIESNAHEKGHIMISYSRKDSEAMKKIKGFLELRGVKTWVDTKDIGVGDTTSKEIDEAIRDSVGVVFVMSNISVSSEYCKREVGIAREYGKKIFPVCLQRHGELAPLLKQHPDLHFHIAPTNWLYFDMNVEPKVALQKLLESIRRDELALNQGTIQETQNAFAEHWPQSDCKACPKSREELRVEGSKKEEAKTVKNSEEDLELSQEFVDATMREFTIGTFRKFALSKYGLRLPLDRVTDILDSARDAGSQKLALLSLWKEMNGKKATVEAIRAAVENYRRHM